MVKSPGKREYGISCDKEFADSLGYRGILQMLEIMKAGGLRPHVDYDDETKNLIVEKSTSESSTEVVSIEDEHQQAVESEESGALLEVGFEEIPSFPNHQKVLDSRPSTSRGRKHFGNNVTSVHCEETVEVYNLNYSLKVSEKNCSSFPILLLSF